MCTKCDVLGNKISAQAKDTVIVCHSKVYISSTQQCSDLLLAPLEIKISDLSFISKRLVGLKPHCNCWKDLPQYEIHFNCKHIFSYYSLIHVHVHNVKNIRIKKVRIFHLVLLIFSCTFFMDCLFF